MVACVGVRTSDGKTHRAAHVLVTTGGTSYPATGSDGSGYKLARQAGHTIVPPQPSLCSLVSPDPACRQMMGLSLRNVTLTLLKDGKPLFTEQGEALFTHFGISGPLVLSASTYIDDVQLHRYIAEFDLKPALDEKTLYDRLTRDFAALGGHSAQGALEKLLPNSMRSVAVKKVGRGPRHPCRPDHPRTEDGTGTPVQALAGAHQRTGRFAARGDYGWRRGYQRG